MKNRIIKMLSMAGVMLTSPYIFGEGGYFTYTHMQKVKDENGSPTKKTHKVIKQDYSEELKALEDSGIGNYEMSTSPTLVRRQMEEMEAIVKAAKTRLEGVEALIEYGKAGIGRIFVGNKYVKSPIVESIQKRGSVYDLDRKSARREKGELEAIINLAEELKANLEGW